MESRIFSQCKLPARNKLSGLMVKAVYSYLRYYCCHLYESDSIVRVSRQNYLCVYFEVQLTHSNNYFTYFEDQFSADIFARRVYHHLLMH